MMSNKCHPTINSTCTILIKKLQKPSDTLESDYLNKEEEIRIHFEDINTPLDVAFMKTLFKTKLGESGVFQFDQVRVEYKLLNIIRHKSIHELSDEEKIQKAVEHKVKGTELFSSQKFDAAFYKFQRSVHCLILMNDKNNENMQKLYSLICNNMALCQMKFNNFTSAIDLCTKVLKFDEMNVKALYRRSMSYIQLKMYELAYEDLNKALKIENNNASLKKQLQHVQQILKVQNENYKKIVKNMFK